MLQVSADVQAALQFHRHYQAGDLVCSFPLHPSIPVQGTLSVQRLGCQQVFTSAVHKQCTASLRRRLVTCQTSTEAMRARSNATREMLIMAWADQSATVMA